MFDDYLNTTMIKMYKRYIGYTTSIKKIAYMEKYYHKYSRKLMKQLMILRSFHDPMIALDDDDSELEYLVDAQIMITKYSRKF